MGTDQSDQGPPESAWTIKQVIQSSTSVFVKIGNPEISIPWKSPSRFAESDFNTGH